MSFHDKYLKYKQKYLELKGGSSQSDICAICMNPMFGSGRPILHTRCNHYFHSDCITRWCVSRNPPCRCPLCNSEISRDQLTTAQQQAVQVQQRLPELQADVERTRQFLAQRQAQQQQAQQQRVQQQALVRQNNMGYNNFNYNVRAQQQALPPLQRQNANFHEFAGQNYEGSYTRSGLDYNVNRY